MNETLHEQSEESSDASSDLKRPTYNGSGMYRAGSVVRKSSADVERNGRYGPYGLNCRNSLHKKIESSCINI